MNVIQKIALRLLLFAGLIVAMNFVYALFFLEADIQKHSPIINQVRAIPKDADILYIGESSNVTSAAMDVDKRRISDFVNDHYPTLKVAHITKPASHAGIYKTLLRKVDPSSTIKTVIVTLNLRSFNAQWIYSGLETPLQKSMLLLQDYPPLYNRFLLSFKGYPHLTEKESLKKIQSSWKEDLDLLPEQLPFKNAMEWRRHIEKKGIKNEAGDVDSTLTSLATEFVGTYAFQIDLENNPRIKDFQEIIALAKERNWNLVFNLLGENLERAGELVGPNLTNIIEENARLLQNHFSKQGVTVVNNLAAVQDEDFLDREWPTEHYTEHGRKIVARNVADALKTFHPKSYSPKMYVFVPQAHFTNDCEGESVWRNMESITTEEAYSGKHSSRTDMFNNFSVIFEYPYAKLPEKKRNSVYVTMKVKAEEFNEQAAVVLDVTRADGTRYWQSANLEAITVPTKKWQRIETTFKLGDFTVTGEKVGICVWNVSNEPVFVDDIDIRFR